MNFAPGDVIRSMAADNAKQSIAFARRNGRDLPKKVQDALAYLEEAGRLASENHAAIVNPPSDPKKLRDQLDREALEVVVAERRRAIASEHVTNAQVGLVGAVRAAATEDWIPAAREEFRARFDELLEVAPVAPSKLHGHEDDEHRAAYVKVSDLCLDLTNLSQERSAHALTLNEGEDLGSRAALWITLAPPTQVDLDDIKARWPGDAGHHGIHMYSALVGAFFEEHRWVAELDYRERILTLASLSDLDLCPAGGLGARVRAVADHMPTNAAVSPLEQERRLNEALSAFKANRASLLQQRAARRAGDKVAA